MIGTIRRHQTWLWVVIITLTVASFVVFGPTNARMGNIMGQIFGNADAGYGRLAGKAITRTQLSDAEREVMLGMVLGGQTPPRDESPELQLQAYQRLLFIQREKDLGIEVSTEAAAAMARRILGQASIDDFVEKYLKPAGLNADDFDRFLRHQAGMEQLQTLASLSGKLVTPQEAETLYRLEHQELETAAVFFSATNYLGKAKVTPEDISKFYTNQMANYRLPDEVQVSYVKFGLSNYTAAAKAALTNLDQIVDANAQRMGTNLYHSAKTPAESKAAMRNDVIRQESISLARRAANAFAQELDDMKPRAADNLEKLAATKGMTVSTTAPFDRDFGPSDMMVSPDFTRKAFSLTKDDPFSGAIAPDDEHPADSVFVIALKDRLPSRTPPLREIEARVTMDYIHYEAVRLAQQASMDFHSAATNGLAQGKSFSAICAAAGVKSQTLPPFSVSTPSLPEEIEQKVNFNSLKQIACTTAPGKVAPVAGTRDGAVVLYVDKQLPIDEAKLKRDMPAFLATVRQGRQADAFNLWFSAQVTRDPEFLQKVKQLNEEVRTHSSNTRRARS